MLIGNLSAHLLVLISSPTHLSVSRRTSTPAVELEVSHKSDDLVELEQTRVLVV
jgi:hypothetical protein